MEERLDMQSPNWANKNSKFIAERFPNCVTETAEGIKIDFDLLQQELSSDIIEGNKERYRLEWPGKREAIVTANLPTTKTLRPVREDSVDFDNTENLYIEGDNLEVLKLLQESYLGKIKMIYIDPPYNTGKDFVYKDNFSKDAQEELIESGQKDEYNQRLVANPESAGRYHSDWLSMMYPRLKLARNLLTQDGVIFISIDDNELDNLKKVCDEIFGDYNFISTFIWQNKKGGGNDAKHTAIEHEYVVMYAKSKDVLPKLFEAYDEEYAKRYKEEDDIGRFFWDTFKRKSGKQYYPIECPDGTILEKDDEGNPISWLRSQERFLSDKKEGEIKFTEKEDGWSIMFKQRLPEGKKPRSLVVDKGTTSSGSSELLELFKKDVFSNPKPVSLIEHFIGIHLNNNDIILDFFSGSGTTAHSLFNYLKNESNINANFILVQLPEDLEENIKTASSGEKRILENGIELLTELNRPFTIPELAKERIRRAAKKIKEETNAAIDYGFRVYRLDSSNMQDVYYKPQDYDQGNLDLFADNVKADRTAYDLLAQVMLDWGLPLSLKIEQVDVSGKKAFKVAENSLYACFDSGIDEDFAKAIAKDAPLRIVFKDSGFRNDTAKTNVKQLLKQLSPETEMKVL